MKHGWEIKRLSEIGKIYNGNSINEKVKKEKYSDLEEGFPFIATKDISFESEIDYDNGIKIPSVVNSSFKTAPKNTVLICAEGGSAGRKIGFTNQVVCFGNKLFALVTNNKIESRYVYYYFFSDAFQKDFSVELAGIIGGVSMNKFKDLEIPIPPLPEQQRIVKIVDVVFEKISIAKSNLEKNIQNTYDLFESYLNGIFENKNLEWEEKTLKEIAFEFGRGKSKHRPRGDKTLLGGKYPLIQTGDISNSEHWITTYSQTYNEKGLAQSKLWPKGTICIAIVGANVAETAILNFDACFPDSVIGIVVNPKKANAEYVEYILQTFKLILKEKGKGTARDNINLGTFENQKFPFPTIKAQENIVKKINLLAVETKKIELIYKQKLEDLEELKKTVLEKAFSGEFLKSIS